MIGYSHSVEARAGCTGIGIGQTISKKTELLICKNGTPLYLKKLLAYLTRSSGYYVKAFNFTPVPRT